MNISKKRDPRFWELWKRSGAIWSLQDHKARMMRIEECITFLYPRSRQYPFDSVCEAIIRAFEERNWQVPGMKVEFDEYGTGEQKFRLVRTLSGDDFRLRFGRPQGRLGRWNDTAAIDQINVPHQQLNVYEDESGPIYHVYVGSDWGSDKAAFMQRGKVNSKLNDEPRTYLKYKGSWGGPYIYPRQRAPYLAHDNDLGREYDPIGEEPKRFKTEEVFLSISKWLVENVLGPIEKQPILAKAAKAVSHETEIPWPSTVGPLFTFGKREDEERIRTGRKDKTQLEPSERHGMLGTGYRLVPLGTAQGRTVPKIAFEGFLWCGVAEVTPETKLADLCIPGYWGSDREVYVIGIVPRTANHIYIADHAAYEKRRKELADTVAKDRDRFTDAEVEDFVCARGHTIVPISEYKGGYEDPVVLINRELGFDEVEVMSGPHKR